MEKKNIRKTHTHLTPKNKKKNKKKRYEKNENNDVIIISTSISPLFHPRNIYTSAESGKEEMTGRIHVKSNVYYNYPNISFAEQSYLQIITNYIRKLNNKPYLQYYNSDSLVSILIYHQSIIVIRFEFDETLVP